MNTTLAPHQQRVLDERIELADRVNKLMAFMASNFWRTQVDKAEQGRMARQLGHMSLYLAVLNERIAAFPKPVPPPERLTTDPAHPALTRGVDTAPTEQAATYLVLPDAERAKGFTRPYRDAYKHTTCTVDKRVSTTMGAKLSETYARDPKFYGSTYCCACRMHKPVGEFTWVLDGEVVGS